MENNLHSSYVMKALDAYPYNLEETLEALIFALSYNSRDVHALCLMGRLYAEQLTDYETAKRYFVEALSENLDAHYIYPYYIHTLICNDDFVEAEKLLNYAFNVKGIDRSSLFLKKGQLYEATGKYALALSTLKEAQKGGLNNDFVDFVKDEISRVEKKVRFEKKTNEKQEPIQKKSFKFGLF